VRLSALTGSSKRLALVGLAKNTGKTETLAALLRELQDAGRRVGVTSVGRDGEERDVIDARIAKPRVRLPAGSLVATTDSLLRASALPHELLEQTGVRTPLGRVVIARVRRAGAVEIAGPSAAADVRAVSDAMLAHGAEQVLIDGAVDRRAASSPRVCDGLVLATGAVLGHDLEDVVVRTRDAVELVRLPAIDGASQPGSRLRALAADARENSLLIAEDGEPFALPPRFVLTADSERLAQLLDEHPTARWLLVSGALQEQFLAGFVHALRHRGRELTLLVADPTKVFLGEHGPEWYRRQGVQLLALERICLQALTVNPLAPESHRFDTLELRARLTDAIPDVPIFDVKAPDYVAAARG